MSPGWVLRRALLRVRRAPLFLLALTLAFATVAGLAAAAETLARASLRTTEKLGSSSHVVAYLDGELPPERAAALAVAFGRLGGVAAAREIDGRAALAELSRTLEQLDGAGARQDLLAGIEAELLPRSIEITLVPGKDLAARAKEVAARLGRLEGVAAVDTMTDGVARVAGFAMLAGRLGALFSAVAALAGIALLGGLVLRERAQHRELGETLHLLGAGPIASWLPLGIGDALAAVVGGTTGLVAGAWLTAVALGEKASAEGIAIGPRETLLAIAVLVGLGLVTGFLSLPRARGVATR